MVGTFARMATKKFKRVYLADWRKKAGWRQKDLADLLGVAEGSVSRWESGGRNLDVDDLVGIAAVLSKKLQMPIEPSDLFRHPETLSLDSMLRGASEAKKKQAAAIIRAYNDSEGEK